MERRDFIKLSAIISAGAALKCGGGDTGGGTGGGTTDTTYSIPFNVRDIFTSEVINNQTVKVQDAKGNIVEGSNGESLPVVNNIQNIDIPTLNNYLKGYIVGRTAAQNLSGDLAFFKDETGPRRTDYQNNALSTLANGNEINLFVIPKSFASAINPESNQANLITLARQLGNVGGASGEDGDGVNMRYDKLQDPNTTTVNSEGQILYSLNQGKAKFIKSRDLEEAKHIDEFLGTDGYPLFHKNNYNGKITFFFDQKKGEEIVNQGHSTLGEYMAQDNVMLNPRTGKTFNEGLENTILASKGFAPQGYSSANAVNSKIQVIPSAIWEYTPEETDVRGFIAQARERINNTNTGIYIQAPSEVSSLIDNGLTTLINLHGGGVHLNTANGVITDSHATAYYKTRVLGSIMEEVHSGVTGQHGDGNIDHNAWLKTNANRDYVAGASEAARLGSALPVSFKLSTTKLLDNNTI